ncbi:MAG: response regulator [Chloroflexota bacterium]|nr:response regulator [Chloroflexota bacterium]
MADKAMKKVLIVDDDPKVFKLVQLHLALENIEILQALDAHAGLDIAVYHNPDVVVLDVKMPGMSGLEMCRTLRDMPQLADTPVIMLSARITPEDIAAGYEAGADKYVTKPFKAKDLAILIKDMMN